MSVVHDKYRLVATGHRKRRGGEGKRIMCDAEIN